MDSALAIRIVPNWQTQSWHPKFTKLLLSRPSKAKLLPEKRSNVHLTFKSNLPHTLGNKLGRMAYLFSGDPWRGKGFYQQLGDPAQKNKTTHNFQNGINLLINNLWIPFVHLRVQIFYRSCMTENLGTVVLILQGMHYLHTWP